MWSKRLLLLIIPAVGMQSPLSTWPKGRALGVYQRLLWVTAEEREEADKPTHFKGMAPAQLVYWGTQPPWHQREAQGLG